MSAIRKSWTDEERNEARRELRAMLKPGGVVHVVQRHVAGSGMTRYLSLFVVRGGNLRNVTHLAARVMDEPLHDWHGYNVLRVGGCGMDMHFATVYNLSRALFPKGHKCTGVRGCPSNDHSNDYSTAQRAYYDEHPEDREVSNVDREERLAAHARMREYVDHRLTTDLGYTRGRMHRDGGYALSHRTV